MKSRIKYAGRVTHFQNLYNSGTNTRKKELAKFLLEFGTIYNAVLKVVYQKIDDKYPGAAQAWALGTPDPIKSNTELPTNPAGLLLLEYDPQSPNINLKSIGGLRAIDSSWRSQTESRTLRLYDDMVFNLSVFEEIVFLHYHLKTLMKSRQSPVAKITMYTSCGHAAMEGHSWFRDFTSIQSIELLLRWAQENESSVEKGLEFYRECNMIVKPGLKAFEQKLNVLSLLAKENPERQRGRTKR